MDAATLPGPAPLRTGISLAGAQDGRVISPAEFRKLLTSRRVMVRAYRRADRQRRLRDVVTGEHFMTDERRLMDGQQ